MRTLICEGIGAFIVVESWPLFLGVEVFSLYESSWIIPNVMDKTFPCREGLSLMRVSSGILLVLGFLFPLGFYQDSGVLASNLSLGFCYALGSPIVGPGLGSVRPNIMKVRHANFYPFSCPFHPMVRHAWVDEPIGWQFNILGVDGLRFLELTVESSWS